MPPLNKTGIQVTIIDDSQRERCEAKCGVDWSSTEAISLAAKGIKDRFGDRVQLEYIDLSEAVNSHHTIELSQKIKSLPLPVLVINGESRISGQFDIRMLLDAIDAEIEIRP